MRRTGLHSKYSYGDGLDIHYQYVTACVAAKRSHEVEKLIVQEFQRSTEGLENICRFIGKYLFGIIVMEATTQTPLVYNALVKYTNRGWIIPELRVIHPSLIKKCTGEIHEEESGIFDLGTLGLTGRAKGSILPHKKIQGFRILTREMRLTYRDCTKQKTCIKRVLTTWDLPLNDFDLSTGYAIDFIRAFLHARGDFDATLDSILQCTLNTPTSTKELTRRHKTKAYESQLETGFCRIVGVMDPWR